MKKSAQTILRPDAFYTIAAANGRVLEVADFNTENGASVRLWSYEGQPWQQWQFVEAGEDEYRIKNRFTGKVMDLVDMRVENGAQAQIWQDVSGENQLWKLDPVPERLLEKNIAPPPAKAAKAPAKGARAAKGTRTQTTKKSGGKSARRTSKNK